MVLGLMGALLGGVAAGQGPAAARPPAPAAQPGAAAPDDGTESLPPGAAIQTLLSGMTQPIAMAFDPAGRLFYTERNTGNVRLFANGVLQASPVINFSISNSGERGLLGIAVDPDFNTNRYIYVYYTSSGPSGPCATVQNRVARFIENNGVGSSPTTIFTSCQSAGNHVGGNIHFGPDGKLYISIGDNGNQGNSQDVQVTQGKMHRINKDGSAAPGNPVFTPTGALPSLYARGLRNSFDFGMDPLDAVAPYRFFASENGPNCDDELNRIEPGFNYGWRAGYPCGDTGPPYNSIPPLWSLPSGQCCIAPTGAHVYTGHQIPQWYGHLFMAGYNNQSLRHFYLDATRTGAPIINVVQGVAVGTDLETGPDGALWYIEGGGYAPGALKRIAGPAGAALQGHVTWEGRPAQPHAANQLPITLTLQMGATVMHYPARVTDASGVFTVPVGALPGGVYTWWAKGPRSLAAAGAVTLSGAPVTQQEMGLQRAGDVDDNNLVDITDFTLLRSTFGPVCGQPVYDDRADFTGDCLVDITDFALLRGNFGQAGPPPPARPEEESRVNK
jgi:glucose/arabinose dehydrogenase